MADGRQGGAWPAHTYNGFSGPAGAPPPSAAPVAPPVPTRRNGLSRGVILGGVATALGAGLVFGLVSRPALDGDNVSRPARMEPGSPRATMPVEVAAAPAAPTATSERLEVLPSGTRGADAAPPPPAAQVRREPRVSEGIQRSRPATAPDEPMVARLPAAPAGPSFNCRSARSQAETMICGDPGLARLDRRLDQAFRGAVAAGVPYRQLRDEQDDWLGIREFAAQRSPADVASIYRQRIAELNAMAE